MKDYTTTFGFSVSHTTQAPREKVVNGVHYHFTKRSIMEKDIRDGKFLETATVHGNLYGTSIEAVEAVTNAGRMDAWMWYIHMFSRMGMSLLMAIIILRGGMTW